MDTVTLKKILKEHDLWIKSDQEKGKQANLQLNDFRGANLQEINLRMAILPGANFKEADLRGADLREAHLQGAHLQKADLQGANLLGAHLQGAYLSEAILPGANLQGVNLQEADIRMANLRGADLQGTDLRGADLRGADLRGADLQKADLQVTKFQGADLRGADLREANLQAANLIETHFQEADLRGANFNFCRTDIKTYKLFLSETYFYEVNVGLILPQGFSHNAESITRSIEFSPEYHQAGMNILSYFQTVLRNKYPNDRVKVKIEQEGLTVAMTIESPDGESLKKYEKTLDEYGLVLRGEMLPKQLLNDERNIMELENQLSMAKYQCEINERLICRYENDLKDVKTDYKTLLIIVGDAVKRDVNVNVDINNSPQINIIIKTELPQIQGALNELKDELPSDASDELHTIQEIQDSFEQIKNCENPGDVAKSSTMSKCSRFLESLNDAESTIAKTIQTTRNGVDIAQKIAKHYNSMAEWCGLPVVPKVFLKSL